MSTNMKIESSSSINSRGISSSFQPSSIGFKKQNNKRFHITIISNYNCKNISNVYTIGNRPHKEFHIYREVLDPTDEKVHTESNKHLPKLLQIEKNVEKEDQEDLIIFD